MAVGLAKTDAIFYAAATGVGNPDRLSRLQDRPRRHPRRHHGVGRVRRLRREPSARPCRSATRSPEKLLLEACLELMASGAVIAIQDMGAAGLTCSAVEMGAKGDLGVDARSREGAVLAKTGMTAYEMMLSESQERMLMVLKPGKEARPRRSSVKWGLDFAVIGKTTDTKRFVMRHQWRRDGRTCRSRSSATRRHSTIGRTSPTPTSPSSTPPRGAEPPMPRMRSALRASSARRTCARSAGSGSSTTTSSSATRAEARRRRRRSCASSDGPKGLALTDRRDAALLRGRPGRGRQAGGGGSLAQHHGGGRPCRSRSPTT